MMIFLIFLLCSFSFATFYIVLRREKAKELTFLYDELEARFRQSAELRLELSQLKMEITVLREESDELLKKVNEIRGV